MKEKDLSCFDLVFTACSVLGRLLAGQSLNLLVFGSGYSTAVLIFILLSVIKKKKRKKKKEKKHLAKGNRKVYLAFTDYQKAFDRVHTQCLCSYLRAKVYQGKCYQKHA